MKHYYLRGKRTYSTEDILKWSKEFEKDHDSGNNIVAQTNMDKSKVSTVFIGLDHQYRSGGPKLIYETMIFGGERDEEYYRYSTWGQAEKGHNKLVKEIMGMYDHVYCKQELLNLTEEEKEFVYFSTEFQTKSLDKMLKDFYISDEGLFHNLKIEPFTGIVNFYTDIKELDRWIEFNAKFFDGELQEIIRV